MRLWIESITLAALLVGAVAQAAPKQGDSLPPFSLNSSSGRQLTHHSLEKTDLGLLYFFSTENCRACRSGLEQLQEIAAAHPDDALRILALGKQDLATLKKAVSVPGDNFHLLAADPGTLERYNARYVLPTTYVTGPGGVILNVFQGGGASTEVMLLSLAEKQLQRRKAPIARKLYAAAEKTGGGSLARAGVGYSLLKEGKLDEAATLFGDLAKSKDREAALRGREGQAEVDLARGRAGLALKLADGVLAEAPQRASANLIRARALHQMGDKARVETALAAATLPEAAVDYTWQKSDALVAQANVLRHKAPRIALASLRTAAKDNPHSVEALSNLGALEQTLGDPARAMEALQKAQALAPGDKLLHSLMLQARESMAQKQDLEKQRYIDETVKDLVARFREQETRKAQTPGDDWTTPPMVLSVLDFQQEDGGELVGRIGLDDALAHDLRAALMARGIQVVERALIDKLLAELKLGASDLADPETQLRLGRILAARLIVSGGIGLGARPRASMRLIDTETTAIALASQETIAAEPDPAALGAAFADRVARALREKYPRKGRIALVDGDQVILNLGRKHGLQPGQRFNVLGTPVPVELNGKVLGYRETREAELEVTEVQDGLAYARVLAKSAPLAMNQRVLQRD